MKISKISWHHVIDEKLFLGHNVMTYMLWHHEFFLFSEISL